jgi:uncharacterized membrane protein
MQVNTTQANALTGTLLAVAGVALFVAALFGAACW